MGSSLTIVSLTSSGSPLGHRAPAQLLQSGHCFYSNCHGSTSFSLWAVEAPGMKIFMFLFLSWDSELSEKNVYIRITALQMVIGEQGSASDLSFVSTQAGVQMEKTGWG